MNLNNGEFKTDASNGSFDIRIKQESDCSLDGGYEFEVITNIFELDKETAEELIKELQAFCDA